MLRQLFRNTHVPAALAAAIVTTFAACSSDDGAGPNGGGDDDIASITVTAPAGDVERTLTRQATAVARDAAQAVISNPQLTWSSSNTNVATVSNSGLITITGRGTARITAANGGVSGFVDVTGYIDYTFIATGNSFACDEGSIGLVHCWGSNGRGQFGTGNTSAALTPATATGTVRLVKLDAGGNTVCGLTAAGAAYCAGENSSGQLGIGATGDRNVFTAVTGGLTFTTITVGEFHACGLTAAGAAYCWGDNFDGVLGNNSTTNSNAPVLVSGGLTFAKISAGTMNTCGVTADNRGFCWGQDYFGQIGDGGVITNNTVDKKLVPTQVVGGNIWSVISPGATSVCGVTTAGAARCWGNAGSGAFGNGDIVPSSSPAAPVTGGLTFRTVDVSESLFACGLTTANQAYCWGANLSGQLGAALPVDLSNAPIRAAGTLTFSELSVSSTFPFVCGISVDGRTTQCWGDNGSGQMGNGATSTARNPNAGIVTGQTPQ
jgi:alpha-tubulin suppressor-like RCC1 family protein